MAKMTVELSDKLDRVVTELAEEQAVPKSQIVRRAVALMRYLEQEASEGGQIVVRHGDKEQVIVFHGAI